MKTKAAAHPTARARPSKPASVHASARTTRAAAHPEFSPPVDILSATEPETTEGSSLGYPSNLCPVRFGYFQPNAREVYLAGSFNGWDPRSTPMRRDSVGDWTLELALPPGEYRYRFVVDGEWREDPQARQTIRNPFGGFDAVIEV